MKPLYKFILVFFTIPLSAFAQPFNGLTEMSLNGKVKTATILEYDGHLDFADLKSDNYFIKQVYHFDNLGYYEKIESSVKLGLDTVRKTVEEFVIMDGKKQINLYENDALIGFKRIRNLSVTSYMITSYQIEQNEIYDYETITYDQKNNMLYRKYLDLEADKFVVRSEETKVRLSRDLFHLILKQRYNPKAGHIWYRYKKFDKLSNPTITLKLNDKSDKKGNYTLTEYTYY